MNGIAILGRLPRPGRVKTRLARVVGPEAAAALYRAFLLDVADVARAAAAEVGARCLFSVALAEGETLAEAEVLVGLPAIRQPEGALGERIEHARAAVGARRVVVLGSDAPTMLPARIVEAFRALGGADAVLGPTADGGYDLIGFDGPRPALLEAIPWSTAEVAATTRARAREAGMRLAELSVGYDIDEVEDLDRARADAAQPGSLAVRTRAALALPLD